MAKTHEDDDGAIRVNVLETNGRSRSGWVNCHIGEHLQFSAEPLASYFFAQWEPVIFDALLLAAAVEFCDRIKRRSALKWMREIELRIPVHEPSSWMRTEVADSLKDALELLTGDRWRIEFSKRKKEVAPPQQGLFNLPPMQSPAVIPFSEGLDSRSVAGLMAKEYGDRLIRVRLGTKTDDRPKESSGRKSPFTAVPYKVARGEHRFPESSARSRGFKFALLSGLAAYLAKADLIIVPESGQGALGPALVPVGHAYEDYRNHPLFTAKMSAFLKVLLGQDVQFEFPRLWHTKGETLRDYVSGSAQADWADTRSCWQDNRKVSVDKHRRQCGVCAACMLRRLSVHAAGLSEAPGTYIWEDLRARSFESGAAGGFQKISAQRNYAIAGGLHLDHLAGLRRSRIHAPSLESCARQIAKALGKPQLEARAALDRLLARHEKEWKEFMEFLGPDSFVFRWTEGVHDHAA
jgi:7-cyano-7-deazaguanine synthase in queuosine biosynthesis